jgi:hypothetical protein
MALSEQLVELLLGAIGAKKQRDELVDAIEDLQDSAIQIETLTEDTLTLYNATNSGDPITVLASKIGRQVTLVVSTIQVDVTAPGEICIENLPAKYIPSQTVNQLTTGINNGTDCYIYVYMQTDEDYICFADGASYDNLDTTATINAFSITYLADE